MDLDDSKTMLVRPGEAAGPDQSQRLMLEGGAAVTQCATLTGWDVFEYMVRYCLKILSQAGDGICGFYIDDFDSCDEYTLRVIQRLISRSGYTTSDFIDSDDNQYKGFWAWRTK